MTEFMTPDEVDEWLKLPRGKAARMARKYALPAVILPDGTIRFDPKILTTFLFKDRKEVTHD